MSYTKRQFIEEAFAEIGMSPHDYDLEPEQLQSAMSRLDAMVATWGGKGIRFGWPFAVSPENADLDTETGAPLIANEAIILGLAVRLAPSYGKAVSQDTRTNASRSYKELIKKYTNIREMQMPSNMPAGAGNKTYGYGRVFLDDPSDCKLR